MAQAPFQGLSRFRLNYSLADIMQEDRLLRAVIVTQAVRATAATGTPNQRRIAFS